MQKITLPVAFNQFDDKWKNAILGFNTDPKYNFNDFACLLCCLADICQLYQKDTDPLRLNEALKLVDGYGAGTGNYSFGAITRIYSDISERHVNTPDLLTDDQMLDIHNALNNGAPVLLGIDYNPKTLAVEYHFVLAVGFNPDDENDITIADSLGGRIHSLKDYLGFFKGNARKTIQSYTIYNGPAVVVAPVPEPSSPTNPLPSNYGDIIHNSTQWDSTVNKYGVGKESKDTSFEEVDAVIVQRINIRPEVQAIPPQDTNENWKQICDYLEVGKNPEDTTFDNVKRAISGIKSRTTDLQNKRTTAEKDAATAQVTIVNQQEDLGNLARQASTTDKLHRAELDALKQNVPNFDKLQGTYKEVLAITEAKVIEYAEELKRIRIENSHISIDQKIASEIESDLSTGAKVLSRYPWQKIFDVIKTFLVIKQ